MHDSLQVQVQGLTMKIEEAGQSKSKNKEFEKEAKKYAKNGSTIRKGMRVHMPSSTQKLQ